MKAYVPWDIQYTSELKLGPGCIAGEQDRLRIPQERIAARLRLDQKAIYYHLGKKAELPFSLNTELRREFTVPQVAEKHRWLEPLSGLLRWKEKTIS